jgi:hypothetical protein
MNMGRLNFIDSEYFYWNNEANLVRKCMKLLPNAPKSIREEYEAYICAYEEYERMNDDIHEELLPTVLPEDVND